MFANEHESVVGAGIQTVALVRETFHAPPPIGAEHRTVPPFRADRSRFCLSAKDKKCILETVLGFLFGKPRVKINKECVCIER